MVVHPRILQPATFPPFDLYIRAGDQGPCTLFRKANEPVYANTWDKLNRGGFDVCYVREEDRNRCFDYVEENLPAILAEESLPKPQAAGWLYRILARATESLFGEPDSYRAYKRVRDLVALMAGALHEDPDMAWDMADCAPRVYSMPTHSVNVSIQLVSLAGGTVGIDQPDLLAEVALGGLLHDLGKTMVSAGILTKAQELTRNEFAQVKRHPRYGLKITAPYLRHAATAQRIIGQHHENACGGGYPDGRSGEAIHVFARAARIVDVFDALTSRRPYGPALDYYGALRTMVSEMRGQFDVDMLRKFIKHLGVEGKAVVAAATTPAAEAPPAAAVLTAADEEPPTELDLRLEPAPHKQSADHSTSIVQFGEAPPTPVRLAEPVRRAAAPRVVTAPPTAEEVAAPREEGNLLSGILAALHNALEGPFGEAVRAAARSQPASAAGDGAGAAAREAEIESARAIFPVVWQVDEWRGQFAGQADASPETRRLTADVLGLLGGLREALARLLEAHHVEIVETAAAELRHRDGKGATATAQPQPAARAGFVHRSDRGVEVLEPARVDLKPERRKAG
jgi:hypothetical protein